MEKKEGLASNQKKESKNLFSKEQLLFSERFRDRRDILSAVLNADRKYSIEAAEQAIAEYMKGQVK